MGKKIRADLSLLSIAAFWGLSFPLMKNVLNYISSFSYLSLRFIIAGIVLTGVFNRKLKAINKKALLYGCMVGLMLFGGMALQVSGLYYTTASKSAFITGLCVIMVPVVSAMLLKKKPDASAIIGVALALAGLFFLVGGLDFSFNKGDFLTFLCAVCFTFHIILIDRFTRECDAEILATLQIIAAAIFFTIVWFIFDKQVMAFSAVTIYTILFTGVLGTALAFAVQTIAQKYTSPTHTVLILITEPVFGAIFAILLPHTLGGGETLQLHTAVGCALILMGMITCELGGARKKES